LLISSFNAMIYSYQAKDRQGRTVTGALDAPDERQAAHEIREMGYFPMRVAAQAGAVGGYDGASGYVPVAAGTGYAAPAAPPISVGRWLLVHLVYSFWTGVGLRDLALMYRQFAAMLGAGVPIYQALTTLSAQTSNTALRRALGQIAARVYNGEKLTLAMAEIPWIFTEFHRSMVYAGEQSGRMDVMMNRLSLALEQEYTLRSIIKKETRNPAFALLASFLLPDLVDLVVKGNAKLYFHDAVLPLLYVLMIALAVFVATKLLSRFKFFYDSLVAHLPPFGSAVRMVALARFARVLSSLYAAGLPIPEILKGAAAATGNAYMERRMISAIPAIEGGHGLTEALRATRVFPPLVLSMLATGEQTGSLDMTMDKVAEYYEAESITRLHQMAVALGAFATMLIGIRVAMVLAKFYTGYLDKMQEMANPDGP